MNINKVEFGLDNLGTQERPSDFVMHMGLVDSFLMLFS